MKEMRKEKAFLKNCIIYSLSDFIHKFYFIQLVCLLVCSCGPFNREMKMNDQKDMVCEFLIINISVELEANSGCNHSD